MPGIISYGSYIPYSRLQRAAIGAALKTVPAGGTRAVASYDEDTTSMALEASRFALAAAPGQRPPRSLLFSTTTPAYLDKTNATAVHAALDLDPDVFAADMIGSVRTGVAAMKTALDSPGPTLLALSDMRTGLPGSADERDGGDAAVAFLLGEGDTIAECIGVSSATGEFLDRWRAPDEAHSRVWEERFSEHAYVPFVEEALRGFKEAAVTPPDIDYLIVSGLAPRAIRSAVKMTGVAAESVADDLSARVGNTGIACAGLQLAAVLDRARPGEVIAIVVLSDGCDVLLFRTTELLGTYRRGVTVESQIDSGRDDLDYATFLTWRGQLPREPPRRPDPEAPAAPPSLRSESWKFALRGTRCEQCGTRQLPPQRVCLECHAIDTMVSEPMPGVLATIATHTIDHLAFSPSPPVLVGVLDFDGGGRYQCELTDVGPGGVGIGDRVAMTFRRMFTANGIHNYFWKARPLRGGN